MKEILKKQMVSLPVIFGGRSLIDNDIEAIVDEWAVGVSYQALYFTFLQRGFHNFRATFSDMEKLVAEIISQNRPLCIFLILNGSAAKEAKTWIRFIQETQAKREDIFVYPIVYGGGCYSSEKKGGDLEYLYNAGYAARLYFDGDAPTAGARRLSEYANRILGRDIKTEFFPAYDIETARKMAHHINLESFNSFGQKEGSVPKYPIRDNRPYFPILSVKAPCFICGREKIISRFSLDETGGAKTQCYYPEEHEFYHTDIATMFDPWPELKKFTQKKLKTA